MLVLYFAKERYGMRRTRNDKGHSHNRDGRAVCIEALDKHKREAFCYFHPEHAMGNHNWVQCNHRFSADCFLTSTILHRFSFLQQHFNLATSLLQLVSFQKCNFPISCIYFLLPCGWSFFLLSTHLLRAAPSPLYYMTAIFSSLSYTSSALWVLTVKLSCSFAISCISNI